MKENKKRGLKKGQTNNPHGRPKGVKNSKTIILEEFAKMVVEQGADRFLNEMEKLEGKQYVDSFLQMFEFVRPKLARQELTGLSGDEIVVKVKTSANGDV